MLEVTVANRGNLATTVCTLLRASLFQPAVASAIEDKARLAERYVAELPTRLETVDATMRRFRGDHGWYDLQLGAAGRWRNGIVTNQP